MSRSGMVGRVGCGSVICVLQSARRAETLMAPYLRLPRRVGSLFPVPTICPEFLPAGQHLRKGLTYRDELRAARAREP